MSGPVLFDYLGDSQRAFQAAREQKRKSALEQLAGDYYAGNIAPDQQNAAFGAMAANGGDPSGLKKEALTRTAQKAQLLATAPEAARPQLYATIAQEMNAQGFKVPLEYTADTLPHVQQFAQMMLGDKADAFKPMNVSPGGEVVDPRTGKVIHSNTNFAPQRPTWDSARGGWVMPPDQSAPQAPQAGGVSFDFAPGTSPDYQFAVRDLAAQENPGAMEQPSFGLGRGGFVPVVPPKAAAANAEEFGQPQTVLGPDGKPRLVQFGNQGGQRPVQGAAPVESKQGRVSATQLRQANVAKAKLIDLRSMRQQLATVREKFGGIQNTASAGPFGQGLIPTENGRRYDAALALLTGQIRKLTRTPGEGAMSDYESKLAMLANPSRNDYESATQDKIEQISSLIDGLEQGYTAMLDDNGGNADNLAPKAAGLSAQEQAELAALRARFGKR